MDLNLKELKWSREPEDYKIYELYWQGHGTLLTGK